MPCAVGICMSSLTTDHLCPHGLQEHLLYPACVAALVQGRITWRDDGVPIMWSAH